MLHNTRRCLLGYCQADGIRFMPLRVFSPCRMELWQNTAPKTQILRMILKRMLFRLMTLLHILMYLNNCNIIVM